MAGDVQRTRNGIIGAAVTAASVSDAHTMTLSGPVLLQLTILPLILWPEGLAEEKP